MSESASSAAAKRRSLIPVRAVIHSSEVSTICASSSFVTTRSGTWQPSPVIETRAPFARADHDAAVAKVSVPRTASSSPTRAVALAAPDRPAGGLDLAHQRELVARLDDAA